MFLEGLVVLDLCQTIAGAYCTRLFAGLGAEVIKLEPAGGGALRRTAPFVGGVEHLEKSIPFLFFEQGKKSVVLDWTDERNATELKALVKQVGVVVEDAPPGALAGVGLDFSSMTALNAGLVMSSITGFGQSGPYVGFAGEEIVYYALSGLMGLTGDPDREPLAVGAPLAEINAGQAAFAATMAAIVSKDTHARHIDVSITDCAAALLDFQFGFLTGRSFLATRIGNANDKGHPWGVFPCRDGYAAVVAGPADRWPALADLFEESRLKDPRFATSQGRINARDEVDALLLPWLVQHDKRDVFQAGQAAGLAFGYVRDAADILDCPQLNARGAISEVEHPVVGRFKYLGAPFNLGEGYWVRSRAPLLGEHTAEVMARLGLPDHPLSGASAAGAPS